jgi:hypothetical protein
LRYPLDDEQARTVGKQRRDGAGDFADLGVRIAAAGAIQLGKFKGGKSVFGRV